MQEKFDSDDKDNDLGDEYCTNLNDNFLTVFESPIQSSQIDVGDVQDVFTTFLLIYLSF